MEILEGIISVKAAINANSRNIECVYVDVEKYKKRDRKITAFVSFLKSQNIRPEFCERSVIDAFVMGNTENAGSTHGGVVASVGERRYSEISDILKKCKEDGGFCVYLDGVEDPFNLGYAQRALYASGASGLILPYRDRSSGTSVMARSSAGASELLSTALLENSESPEKRLAFIRLIKSYGISVCCAAVSSDSVSLFEYDAGFPMILFIGGEKRGISPEYIENADRIIHIPYASPDIRFSLPTATVAALAGFELMRIKGNTKSKD